MAADDQPISIASPPPQQDQIPISVSTGAYVPVPQDIAQDRATKAELGLRGIVNKSYDDYLHGIMGGQEPALRQEAATQVDHVKAQKAQQTLSDALNKKQGPLTADDYNTLNSMVNLPKTNPNSVFEENYGQKYMNQLDETSSRENTFWPEAQSVIPEKVQAAKQFGAEITAKVNIARKAYQDVGTTLGQQSWLGWGADTLKQFVPGYLEAKLRGNVEGTGLLTGALGTNLNQQAMNLLQQPMPVFVDKFQRIMNHLKADNPQAAQMFAAAVMGQSSSDIVMSNLNTAMDLTAVPDLVLGLKAITMGGIRKAALEMDVRDAIKTHTASAVQNATQTIPEAAVRAEGAGDVREAAIQRTTESLKKQLTPRVDPADPLKEAVEALPTPYRNDANNILENTGVHSRELANRLAESFISAGSNIVDTIANVLKVNRLPGLATEEGVRAMEEAIKNNLPGSLGNSVLDVKVTPHPIANYMQGSVDLGRSRGTLFFSQSEARNFANVHGLVPGSYDIITKGMGKFIRIYKPLNETDNLIRDLLIKTKNDATPTGWSGWVTSVLGGARTPDEALSLTQRMNRKIATYGPSNLLKVAQGELGEIKNLAKWTLPGTQRRQRWLDWQRVVDATRSMKDPVTNLPGRSFNHMSELDEAYQQLIGRLPDDQETAAYFAFKRFNQVDHTLRNVRVYTNKARLGTESHSISFLDETGKQRIKSDFFDGVVRKHIAGGEDTILVNTGSKKGTEKLYKTNAIPVKLRQELEQGVKEGKYKVVEIYDPETRPLSNWSPVAAEKNARIRYVLTDKLESKPLGWDQLPRRGGGHFEYNYAHYIKQAKVIPERVGRTVRHWYEGDTNVMPIQLRAMGQDVVDKLHEFQRLMKEGKTDEAKAHVLQNLPFDWNEFQNWFREHTIGGVKFPARLSLDEPFHVVPEGRSIIDIDSDIAKRYSKKGAQFEDGTKKGSLARLNQVEYTGQRDAYDVMTVRNDGTVQNPLYNLEPAKLVDPIPTMNRALTRIAHSSFMDDYKAFSVEHWLQEANQLNILKADQREIRSSPFANFMTITDNSFRKGAPVNVVKNFKTARYNIQQLIGTPSETDALLNRMSQVLADTIYKKAGPKSIDAYWNPAWMLPKINDPVYFVRSIVTHSKLGLFQIPQLLVQSMTFVDTVGIAGWRYAAPTVHATYLDLLSRVNMTPEVLQHLDGLASKMNLPGSARWLPGEWMEARQELLKNGFDHVAHEYSLLDAPYSNRTIDNAGHKFLDAGMYFFKGGERNARLGSWYTAFKEFRDANPTGKITDIDRAKILERADLLSINMTRASNSRLQRGLLSIPAQFYTYQLRKFELMTGNRLTAYEKGRLFLTNAVMFGVPTSLGVAGYPFGDNLRKYALENGYVVGDNFLSSLTMEGLPAMMIALISGGGDMSKGNWYNVGDRFGTKGFDNIESLYRGDKTLWDLIGGAAYSTLSGAWEATDGFRAAMMSAIRDDNKAFPLKVDDFIEPFKQIASVSNAFRAIAAINTGNWLSSKGGILDTTSPANAIFMSLTGLQSQEISNVNLMSWSLKDQKDLQDYVLKKFIAEFRKGVREQRDNPDQANAYFKRAFTYLHIGGYPQEKFSSAIALASKDEPLIDAINWDFYIKRAPDELKPDLQDAYKSILNRRRP